MRPAGVAHAAAAAVGADVSAVAAAFVVVLMNAVD